MMTVQDATETYVHHLLAREWEALKGTLAADVYREGFGGPDDDAVRGREEYVSWLAAAIDPLHEYHWTIGRRTFDDNQGVAVIEAVSRYRTEADDEPFGYQMVIILTFDSDLLVERVDVYWKTPSKRLAADTVAQLT